MKRMLLLAASPARCPRPRPWRRRRPASPISTAPRPSSKRFARRATVPTATAPRGESEPRRTAGRVYHPATCALQVGTARESGHAGDGGDAATRRDDGARNLFFARRSRRASRRRTRRSSRRDRSSSAAATRRPGIPACAACHAPNGAGVAKNYPRLAGQYADYTYAQLKAFKAGERGADKDGKDVNGGIMATIAARMTDAQMKAVAEYTSGLR